MNKETHNAQKMQDELFKKMTVGEKIKLSSKLLSFARKLSDLNDRKLHGNRGPAYNHSKNTR